MDVLLPIGLFILGALIGAGVAFAFMRQRVAFAVGAARTAADAERATLAERTRGAEELLTELRERVQEQHQELQSLSATHADSDRQLVQYKTMLASERREHGEKLAVLDEAQKKLADAFKALAAEALKSNNQSFLELATANLAKFQETAKGDLDKRQQAIDELVKPVKETLDKFDTKIQDLEKSRVGAYAGLTEQVRSLLDSQKELRSETANLVNALRAPAVRGRWGEIQLRRVVELAGMQEHCDFFEQASVDTEEGRLRPDMLVRLPGNKTIIVDSKVPLAAYLEAIETVDEDARKLRLEEHAAQVRNHIYALSKKAYHEAFESSPEFVVLFLPGEAYFFAALSHDPQIVEEGAMRNVILATPTTLIALLRAVAYGWRQEELAKNAQQISELGKELHKRCADFGGHLKKLGTQLRNAVEAYNSAIGSLESRVLVTARRFSALRAASDQTQIEETAAVDVAPRMIQAPELLSGIDELN